MFKPLIFSALFLLTLSTTNKVCRNPSGKEVDWYSLFFMPASASSDGQIYYGYYDPTMSNIQYYKYSSKAHAKGSLVYDSVSGAFLLHSLPRFPTRTSANEVLEELPSNGGSYGQSFLCISVSKATAETIAKMLNCVNVCINKAVEKDRVNTTPNQWVKNLIANKMDSSCSIEHKTSIRSKSGVEFTFFGKNYKNKIIPYDTTLRSAYSDHFYVRTWSRPALAPSQYGTYNLVNVLDVKWGIYVYGVNKEHSKWAVAKNKSVVCFADLNHTESQKDRGGNIVCFQNQKLHDIMIGAIASTDGKMMMSSANPMYELFRAKNKIRLN